MNVKKIILVSTCMALSTQSFAANTISRGSTQQMDTVQASETDAPTYSKPGELLTRGSGGACNGDESEGYVPLEFLRNISDGAVRSPNEITIKEVGSGVYQIEMEKYMRTCTDLEFEVQKVDNDYFVRVKNNFEFNADNVPLEEGESLDKLLPEEKYYRCMNSKGMLKNGAPDWGKAEQTGDIVYSKTSGKFLVDIGDGKESSSLYFGSPKATSYRHLFEANVRSTPEDWNCMTYENFNQAEEKRLYTSVKDDAYDRALKVCETESAEKILDELAKLRSSSAGNFRELENILEKAFNQAADKRAEEIYARMDAIEEEVSRSKDMDEDTATELGREYSDLAKEINKIVVQPSMERVESLLKERKGAKSKEEKAEIDKKIKEYNDKVAVFSKRDYKKLEKVYNELKEYGLVEEAHNIEGLRLSSHFYGRVYDSKGKLGKEDKRDSALSLETASRKIKNRLDDFQDDHLDKWEMSYAVKNGDSAPIKSAISKIQSMKSQMDSDYQAFQQNEYYYTQKYCGTNMLGQVTNTYKCNQWVNNQNSRLQSYMSTRQNQISYINSLSSDYSGYITSYQAYLKNNDGREPGSTSSFMTYTGNGFEASTSNSSNSAMSSSNYQLLMLQQQLQQQNAGTSNIYTLQNQNSSSNFFGSSPYATIMN